MDGEVLRELPFLPIQQGALPKQNLLWSLHEGRFLCKKKQGIKAHLITKPLAADNAEPPVPPARCPLSPAMLKGGGERRVLLHRTPTLAGRVDEKLKNSNKTNLFSSYSEAGNDDLSHMFQIRENTSVTHL